MSRIVIKAENISKQYRLGLVGTGTIRDDLKRWWHSVRGKEDPFLKIGEANDRSSKGKSDYVWSLQDINFEINQGDSVGIIGRNGAGKSTLLKILSQVTQPTTGKIYTKGRIASLLEVGTGFHPEMTGRENIYLNGAILGMRKHEITRKFDEIVAFSGVERYIDTPVKRYSSGMYVRLAFAVAAHLESEILIVDEVLAVGDADFQKKCLGKMNDVSKGEGRTVLFVSHNMAAVKSLCTKGIVLENGKVTFAGEIEECVSKYLLANNNDRSWSFVNQNTKLDKPFIKSVKVITNSNDGIQDFGKDLKLRIDLYCNEEIVDPAVSYQILNIDNIPLIHELNLNSENEFCKKKGIYTLTSTIRNLKLYQGQYKFNIFFADNFTKNRLDAQFEICDFEIINTNKRTYYWQKGTAQYKENDTDWSVEYREF